jgi:retron-type reverse transcriptase
LPFKDKVLQRAVATILNAIYDVDFYGFSYGFRTGSHDALDALTVAIERKNWILDADIKGFFDSIPHDKLISFLERRIADPRMIRLLRKWLMPE